MNQPSTVRVFSPFGIVAVILAAVLARRSDAQCSNWAIGLDYPGNGTPDAIYDFATYDEGNGERLFASGYFNDWNWSVARWDGTNWTQVGIGPDQNTAVFALETYDDGIGSALYAAGGFTTIGGVSASRVAKWDGTVWSALASGLNSQVNAMIAFDDGSGDALYAAGAFTFSGATPVNRIARWNGSAWSPVGAGLNGDILTLAVFDDGGGSKLYAGGFFAGGLAKWNGSSWSTVGGGVSQDIRAMAVYNSGSGDRLFLGGFLTLAGGQATKNLAAWSGSSWQTFPIGCDFPIETMQAFDDGTGNALYVGGNFTAIGTTPYSRIARWNGTNWAGVGGGIRGANSNATVSALMPRQEVAGARLYVGGEFTIAGANPSNNIARWGDACTPPIITLQPVDTSAVVNYAFSPVTLIVAAVGNFPLSYQWRKSGLDLVDNGRITGATTTTLRIYEWSLNDEGIYDVVINNPLGSATSNAVTVTIPFGTASGLPVELTPGLVPPEPIDNLPVGNAITSVDYLTQSSAGDVLFTGLAQGPAVGGYCLGTWSNGSISFMHKQGDPAPGCSAGTVFANSSSNPFSVAFVIAAGGSSLFEANVSGSVPGFGPHGLWFHDTSGTVLVSRDGATAAGLGAGETLGSLMWPHLSDSGTSVFASTIFAGTTFHGRGIWTWDPSNGQSLVIKTGMPAPGTNSTIADLAELDAVSINASGQIAFLAVLQPSAAAMYVGMPSAPQLVAKTGDPAPGLPTTHTLAGFRSWSLSNAGDVLLSIDVDTPTGLLQGICRSSQGSLYPVVLRGDPAPGMPMATTFQVPLDGRNYNSSGDAVFHAYVGAPCGTCPQYGLWYEHNGVNSLIVAHRMDPLPQAPAGFELSEINEVALNDAGQVAFNCKLYAGGSLRCVYGFTLERGLFPIAVPGMQLEIAPGQFRTIRDAFISSTVGGPSGLPASSSLSDSGTLALRIIVNGSGSGLYTGHFLYFEGLHFGPAEPYCFGDGSGAACPCANLGASGEGCANSTGAGALLNASGTISIGLDDLRFDVTGMPIGVSAILYEGSTTLGGGLGLPFKDGLKCAGGVTRRFPLQTSDGQGHTAWGPGLAAQGAWVAGGTQYFQTWYRNAGGSPCSQFSNMSNAARVTFVP